MVFGFVLQPFAGIAWKISLFFFLTKYSICKMLAHVVSLQTFTQPFPRFFLFPSLSSSPGYTMPSRVFAKKALFWKETERADVYTQHNFSNGYQNAFVRYKKLSKGYKFLFSKVVQNAR